MDLRDQNVYVQMENDERKKECISEPGCVWFQPGSVRSESVLDPFGVFACMTKLQSTALFEGQSCGREALWRLLVGDGRGHLSPAPLPSFGVSSWLA